MNWDGERDGNELRCRKNEEYKLGEPESGLFCITFGRAPLQDPASWSFLLAARQQQRSHW